MTTSRPIRLFLFTCCFLVSACSQADETPAADEQGEGLTSTADKELPPHELPFRKPMTARECQQEEGFVVGDPGDGRIHRDDYLCLNAQPPLGVIVPIEEGPVDIEGAVCCGTAKK